MLQGTEKGNASPGADAKSNKPTVYLLPKSVFNQKERVESECFA